MLLVNGQQNQLTLVDAYVKNGETGVVCPSLDPAPDSNMELVAYPCGFYMYRKVDTYFTALSLHRDDVSVIGQAIRSGSWLLRLNCWSCVSVWQ